MFTIVEILLSIDWKADKLALSVNVLWVAIIPGILMMVYGIIYKIRGKKTFGSVEISIGISLLLVPVIEIGAAFLISGIFLS